MVWPFYTWLALIALGLSLRMGLRFCYGARGPLLGDSLYTFFNAASCIALSAAFLPLLLALGFSYVGIILVGVAVATIVEAVVQRRASQRRSMCKLLAATISRNVPLESSLLAAGQSFRGIVGNAARSLVYELDSGTPIVAAIIRHPKALPPEAVAYLAAGSSNETRAAAFDELSRAAEGPLTAIWRLLLDRLIYLVCVIVVLAAVVTFMLVWIVPQFENIFADFGLELPRETRMVLALSKVFTRYLAAPFFLLLVLSLLTAFITSIYYLLDVPILRPLGDRLLFPRRKGDVLRILAVAAAARQPLAPVLERLAKVYPSGRVRRQLARATATMTAGESWRQALRDARIVNQAEQALLATAEKVGNLPWALREIAERGEKRATYRLAATVQVLYPCLVLLLAVCVGLFAVGMFVPLVNLVKNLV